jgi:hypothetical protein
MRTEPMMSKYSPLKTHLQREGRQKIRMSFAEIEEIIDNRLPPSARKHRPWWSNNPNNSVITYAWLSAGYRTAQVDMPGETLVFVKDENAPQAARPTSLFGALKGEITIAEGVDLTAPALPDWQEQFYKKWADFGTENEAG